MSWPSSRHRPRGRLVPSALTLAMWLVLAFTWASPRGALGASPTLSDTYLTMVETDPYDLYALRRLLEVNKAPGSVNRLIERYSERVDQSPGDRVGWAILGHLKRASEDVVGAVEAFTHLASLSPRDARPLKAVAEIWRRARRWEPMLRAYQSALALTKKPDLKGHLYEEAAEAALEAERPDRALEWLAEYRASAPRSGVVAMNSAELLSRFGQRQAALEAWRDAAQKSRTRLAQQVVIWRNLGTLLEEMDRLEEAEGIWRAAMKKTPPRHWSQSVFLEGLTRVFRRTDRLDELATEWSKRAMKERHLQGALAGLYDGLGQPEKAVAWLTRAIQHSGRDASLHERRIEILRRQDDLLGLDRAYIELIRSAPREARYGLEYAAELFRRGLVTRALKRLDKVTAASRRDPGVWQRALSLMSRHARGAAGPRVLKAYRALIKLEPREPAHPIGLGEVLWESGDKPGAKAAWGRLVTLGRSPAAGQLLHAGVLADHGLHRAARQAFEEALEKGPQDVSCLEAAARWFGGRSGTEDRERAMALWTRLLDLGLDPMAHPRAALRRGNARRNLVELWERAGLLEERLRSLAAQVDAHPGEWPAALLLTELRLHLDRLEEARSGLDSLAQRFPDHLEVLRLRVKLALRTQELTQAVTLLRRIAQRDPRNAGQALNQAAEIAKALEDHEGALALTEEALKLRPEDPRGQIRVGEMRLGLGDRERAAVAWREALRMNPRDDELRAKLAALYRELEDPLREERLLIKLVQDATSNAQVQRAGKRLLNLGIHQGRLEAIERVLRPLALGQGRRSAVHRRLLVELVLKQAQGLTFELDRAEDAEERLLQLGNRALEILLFAIDGTDAALRAQALTVLRLTRPVGAVPALARLLEQGDGISRLHAAVTLGFIGSDSTAEVLGRTLDATSGGERMGLPKAAIRELRYATIWSLGRVGGDVARQRLLTLTSGEHASNHPMVALALAHHPHRDSVRALTQMTHRVGTRARQAALWSLAHLDRDDALPPLAKALRSSHASEAEIALWALGRADTDVSRRLLLDALIGGYGPPSHLIVRALVSQPSPSHRAKGPDPYTRLIDLDQLRLSRGLPDPGELIAATVLNRPASSSPDRSLRFLEALDQRYSRIGQGHDVSVALRALSPLMGRPGLHLPGDWDLSGLTEEEASRWAHRLANHMGPLLEASAPSTRLSKDGGLIMDALARLVASEPDSTRSSALLRAIERALSQPDGRFRAPAWRAARALSPAMISSLVSSYGPPHESPGSTGPREEEWAAFARTAGRCPTAQAEEELEMLLRASSPRVRVSAAQSVTSEHPGLALVLVDLLQDPAIEVARQAAQGLSRLSTQEASRALRQVQERGDPRRLLQD